MITGIIILTDLKINTLFQKLRKENSISKNRFTGRFSHCLFELLIIISLRKSTLKTTKL